MLVEAFFTAAMEIVIKKGIEKVNDFWNYYQNLEKEGKINGPVDFIENIIGIDFSNLFGNNKGSLLIFKGDGDSKRPTKEDNKESLISEGDKAEKYIEKIFEIPISKILESKILEIHTKKDKKDSLIFEGDGAWGDKTPEEYELMVSYLDKRNLEKANEYANELVKKYPKDPRSYLSLGMVNLFSGHISEAFENLKKAEKYIEKIKDKDDEKLKLLLGLYYYLGSISIDLGNMEGAEMYFTKCSDLADKLGYRKAKIGPLVNLATVYKRKQDYEKAEEFYKKAVELTDSEDERAVIYNNLAFLYFDKGEPDKAIEYFKKSVEIDEKIGDKRRAGEHMLNLGLAYTLIGDLENAKKYLDEGLDLAKQTGNKFWEAMGYKYIGIYNSKAGNLKEAEEHLLKSYKMFRDEIGSEYLANDALYILNQIRQIGT
jgi:tetratricopeptide (TPR) repeat protein